MRLILKLKDKWLSAKDEAISYFKEMNDRKMGDHYLWGLYITPYEIINKKFMKLGKPIKFFKNLTIAFFAVDVIANAIVTPMRVLLSDVNIDKYFKANSTNLNVQSNLDLWLAGVVLFVLVISLAIKKNRNKDVDYSGEVFDYYLRMTESVTDLIFKKISSRFIKLVGKNSETIVGNYRIHEFSLFGETLWRFFDKSKDSNLQELAEFSFPKNEYPYLYLKKNQIPEDLRTSLVTNGVALGGRDPGVFFKGSVSNELLGYATTKGFLSGMSTFIVGLIVYSPEVFFNWSRFAQEFLISRVAPKLVQFQYLSEADALNVASQYVHSFYPTVLTSHGILTMLSFSTFFGLVVTKNLIEKGVKESVDRRVKDYGYGPLYYTNTQEFFNESGIARQQQVKEEFKSLHKQVLNLNHHKNAEMINFGKNTGELFFQGQSRCLPNTDITLSTHDLTTHLFVSGPTGKGKTSNVIDPLLSSIFGLIEKGLSSHQNNRYSLDRFTYPHFKEQELPSAFVIDGKGALSEHIKSALGERNSPIQLRVFGFKAGQYQFDPFDRFDGIDNQTILEMIFNMLPKVSSDSFWDDSARNSALQAISIIEAYELTDHGLIEAGQTNCRPLSLFNILAFLEEPSPKILLKYVDAISYTISNDPQRFFSRNIELEDLMEKCDSFFNGWINKASQQQKDTFITSIKNYLNVFLNGEAGRSIGRGTALAHCKLLSLEELWGTGSILSAQFPSDSVALVNFLKMRFMYASQNRLKVLTKKAEDLEKYFILNNEFLDYAINFGLYMLEDDKSKTSYLIENFSLILETKELVENKIQESGLFEINAPKNYRSVIDYLYKAIINFQLKGILTMDEDERLKKFVKFYSKEFSDHFESANDFVDSLVSKLRKVSNLVDSEISLAISEIQSHPQDPIVDFEKKIDSMLSIATREDWLIDDHEYNALITMKNKIKKCTTSFSFFNQYTLSDFINLTSKEKEKYLSNFTRSLNKIELSKFYEWLDLRGNNSEMLKLKREKIFFINDEHQATVVTGNGKSALEKYTDLGFYNVAREYNALCVLVTQTLNSYEGTVDRNSVNRIIDQFQSQIYLEGPDTEALEKIRKIKGKYQREAIRTNHYSNELNGDLTWLGSFKKRTEALSLKMNNKGNEFALDFSVHGVDPIPVWNLESCLVPDFSSCNMGRSYGFDSFFNLGTDVTAKPQYFSGHVHSSANNGSFQSNRDTINGQDRQAETEAKAINDAYLSRPFEEKDCFESFIGGHGFVILKNRGNITSIECGEWLGKNKK